MRRALPATLLLLSSATLLTACGGEQYHEITVEVTGSGGTATETIVKLPSPDSEAKKPGTTTTEKEVTLPWRIVRVTNNGPASVRAVPAGNGTLTCRILSDGEELAKKSGQPGAAVECNAKIVNN
jgi:hypothetical protein